MSVQRHEPCFPRGVIGLRTAADPLVVGLVAVALAAGLGCARDDRRTHPPDPFVPTLADPQPVLMGAGADSVLIAGAGVGAEAGAGAPANERPSPAGDGEQCEHPGCIAPGPIPELAKCHELRNHAPNDRTSPYVVKTGDATTCFYHDVPWTEPSVLVAWQTAVDAQVMHEWQLYTTTATATSAQRAGSAELCIGGGHSNGPGNNANTNARPSTSQLIIAHPRGSNDILMPRGVGLFAPAPGTRLVLQWHHLNTLGAPVRDASLVRLCTLPASAVERVAGMTVLGTETVAGLDGLPPGRYDVEASCPLRDRTARLLMVAPHMHQLGRHVSLRVQRAGGASQPILDVGFAFDRQLMRATVATLRPGDRLTTRCSYDNPHATSVPFGVQFQFEQCFVYAIAEPAGALDNGAPSVLGISNTCW